MGYGPYENIKPRLTERDQLMKAVHKLMAAGISEDLIPTHLVRAFYVDMDELNSVLRSIAQAQQAKTSSVETLLQQTA